jgi:hypothetical protein
VTRGALVLQRGRAKWCTRLGLLIRILLHRLRLRRMSKCGNRTLTERVWCLAVLRRRCGRV